jgi:hypothetical protein
MADELTQETRELELPWVVFPSTPNGNKWRCWVGHKWPEMTCYREHPTETQADHCAQSWVQRVPTGKFTCDAIAHNAMTHFIVQRDSLRLI